MLLKVISFILLGQVLLSQVVPSTGSYFGYFSSGVADVITDPAVKTGIVLVSFTTSFTATPSVVLGLVRWLELPQSIIDYVAYVATSSQTSFELAYLVGYSSSVHQQKYMWLAVDQMMLGDRFNLKSNIYWNSDCNAWKYLDVGLNSGTGYRCALFTSSYDSDVGQSAFYVDPTGSTSVSSVRVGMAASATSQPTVSVAFGTILANPTIFLYLQGFQVTNSVDQFSLSLIGNMTGSPGYTATLCTNQSTTVNYVYFSRLIFSQSAIESTTNNTFVKWANLDSNSGSWSSLSFSIPTDVYIPRQLMAGLSGFSMNYVEPMDFTYDVSSQNLSAIGPTPYLNMYVNVIYLMVMKCIDPVNTYVHFVDMKCYEICPVPTLPDTTTMQMNTCQPCDAKCTMGCSMTSTNCTGTAIICIFGEYDGGDGKCYPCLVECSGCIDATTCLNCAVGYYFDASKTCIACMVGCLECTSAIDCTICDVGYFLSGTNCVAVCNIGEFMDAGTGGCMACSSMCQECLGVFDNCTSCVAPMFLYLGSCQTACPSGTMVSGPTCLVCNAGCLSCSVAASNCTSCNVAGGYFLMGTSCVSSCPSGSYGDAGSGLCSSCMSTCASCSDAFTCDSCVSNLVLNAGMCVCMPGSYFNAGSGLCAPCDWECLSCAGPGSCSNCNTTIDVVIEAGVCVCNYMNGLVLSGGTCVVCSSAYPGCLTCNNVGCVNCDTSLNFVLTGSSCNCTSGFILTGTNCVPQTCPTGCLTCTGGVCSTCDTANNFVLTSGVCSCSTGTYLSTTNVCAACSTVLTGCSACSSSTVCTSCYAPMSLAAGVCTCPSGSFFDGTTCAFCTISNCVTCSSLTVCATCDSAALTSWDGSACSCQTGSFNSSGTCVSCTSGCLSCTSATSCTVCDLANNFVLSGSMCVCNVGSYLAGGVCMSCPTGCTACTSATACLTCDAASHFMADGAGGCVCDSSSGYVFSAGACVPCSSVLPGCQSCSSSTVCTVCMATPNLMMNGTSQCSCSGATSFNLATNTCDFCSTCCATGFYADPSLLTCESCSVMIGCLTCSSASACTSCDMAIGLTLAANATCMCPAGFFLSSTPSCQNCLTTFTSCASCTSTACQVCGANSAMISGSCICNSGYTLDSANNCVACSSLMSGCVSCTSSTICTVCNTANGYVFSGALCTCPPTLIDNGVQCISCAPMPGCTNCTSSTFCLSCDGALYFVLNSSNQCKCQASFYFDGGSCQPCSIGCTSCTSGTSCTACSTPNNFQLSGSMCTCIPGLTLQNGICVCAQSFYPSGGNCLACSGSCVNCTGPTSSECTSCASPAVLSGSTCVCPQGMFQSATPLVCSACDPMCLNCSASVTTCTACDTLTTNRVLSGSSCVCSAPYAETGSVSCGCDASFSMANNVCNEICGDGMRFTLACDDGNTVSGDGCAPDCTIETDFVCRGGNSTAPSECSYNKSIDIVLEKTTKNSTANEVSFQFLVQPPLSSLSVLDFSTCVTTNLTGATLAFQYDSQGILTVVVSYNESIQNADVSLQFAPTVSGVPFFYSTPNSVYNFVVQPDNNQAAVVYPESVYGQSQLLQYVDMGVCALALVGFVVSLFSGKFIGLEMTGVVQVVVIGLAAVDYLHPLLAPLTKIGFINGYNSALSAPTKSAVPARLSALDYCTQMINSLNFTVAVMLLPFLVALGLFIASKVSKTREKTLLQHSKTALCEYGMTGVVFVLYNAVVALSVFLLYFEGTSSSLFPLSIVDAGLTVAALVTVTVLYKLMPDGFGDFKNGFKKDAASQLHYWLVLLFRVLLGVLLVALNDIAFVGFICAGIPLVAVVYLAVRRPYSYGYNNARAIFNEVAMLVVLAIYGYYRALAGYTQHNDTIANILPYVVVGLVALAVIANIGCLIKYFLDRKKDSVVEDKIEQSAKIQKIQIQENDIFLQQTKMRLKAFEDQRTLKTKRRVNYDNQFSQQSARQNSNAAPSDLSTPTKTKMPDIPRLTTRNLLQKPQKYDIPAEEKEQMKPSDAIVLKNARQDLLQTLMNKPPKISFKVQEFTMKEMMQIENDFDAL